MQQPLPLESRGFEGLEEEKAETLLRVTEGASEGAADDWSVCLPTNQSMTNTTLTVQPSAAFICVGCRCSAGLGSTSGAQI